MGKLAIITQSYKNDFNDCRLLCESIDRFAPTMDHFIFVNDEDYAMFGPLNYGHHKVYKKGTILPWYLWRLPIKILGHHFHIGPFTIPVREWIIQQICKLGVYEVIGDGYDAVFNIDSETVLMRPLDITRWVKDGKYMMFQDEYEAEPSKGDYMYSAKKLLGLTDDEMKEIGKWNFMNTPVCFERENTKKLLEHLTKISPFGWKWHLCNTYRFSEYYTYGIFCKHFLKMQNHFHVDRHYFPQVDRSSCSDKNDFVTKMKKELEDKSAMGLWLQKRVRKSRSKSYLDFDVISQAIKEYWDENNK